MGINGREIIMYVYIFVSETLGNPLWKIGFSNNPERRLREIQTGCPFSIKEYDRIECADEQGARKIEKAIHDKLSPHKQRGGKEWYKTTEKWMHTVLFEVKVRL